MTRAEARIVEYIRNNGSITSMDAFYNLGETKLATKISNIIREGQVPIKKEREVATNRYGEKVSFVRYRIGK